MDRLLSEDEPKKGQPWPIHSSQVGLAKELMESGITVGLTYIVTPVEHQDKDTVDGN